MSIGFANLAMLAALAAVVIPLLVHLVRRRRYQTVDWGAMQFLHFSQRRRQRLRLEELLLLLLRMGLIVVFVLALAAPYSESSLWPDWTARESKDVVLILDVSTSMGYDDGKEPTPFEQARRWTETYLEDLGSSDRVALVQARLPLMPSPLTTDLDQVRARLAELPAPGGVAAWPAALENALQLLEIPDRNPRQQIILLKDCQAFGWSDADTLVRWEALARRRQGNTIPAIQAIEFGPLRPTAPNLSLAPLRAAPHLPVADQTLRFTTALQLDGVTNYQTPRQVRVEVDGQTVRFLPPPANGNLVKGQMPLSFEHRFTQAGSQAISVIVEAGQPDSLAGDNRQDLAVVITKSLPILLVDGAERPTTGSGAFFLEKALRSILTDKNQEGLRIVSYEDWDPAARLEMPRLIVLADVPRLRKEQAAFLPEFLAAGGRLLILPGDRGAGFDKVHAAGWMPARLEKIGAASEAESAPTLDLRSGSFPPLQVFRDQLQSAIGQASFPKWWKLTPGPAAAPVAWLSNGDPWLVEQVLGRGRVLLCATPLDRSWQATLPTLPEFPILIHELTTYLIGDTFGRFNLPPGQPFRWTPALDQPQPRILFITGPDKKTHTQRLTNDPWLVFPDAGPGAYQVSTELGETRRFVSTSDPRESDLTPCTDENRNQVRKLLSLTNGEADGTDSSATSRQDLWWLFLAGVVMLLVGEIIFTRRMALKRQAAVR